MFLSNTYTALCKECRRKQPSEVVMLDLIYLALGVGILLALGLYARALGRM